MCRVTWPAPPSDPWLDQLSRYALPSSSARRNGRGRTVDSTVRPAPHPRAPDAATTDSSTCRFLMNHRATGNSQSVADRSSPGGRDQVCGIDPVLTVSKPPSGTAHTGRHVPRRPTPDCAVCGPSQCGWIATAGRSALDTATPRTLPAAQPQADPPPQVRGPQ
jgi:hypothetical protein